MATWFSGHSTTTTTPNRYNLGAKQLHNMRKAATSGALRRRAAKLDVRLPAGYVDRRATTIVRPACWSRRKGLGSEQAYDESVARDPGG
jgi:hypothetical protein